MNLTELISLFTRYARGVNEYTPAQFCGLAEGTNDHTLKTTVAITYNIYNARLTKTITDNIAMTACAAQAAETFCYYLVSINSSGTVTVTKGTNDTYALPTTPAGNVPIGAFKIVTGAATTFTSGTTDLSAAGITATFYDMDCGITTSLINRAQEVLERGVTIVRNGREITVSNWDYMLVRADATALAEGDTTVTLPFSRFKCFADNGVILTNNDGDSVLDVEDSGVPTGATVRSRPTNIMYLPTTETSFTPDVAPSLAFSVWPECDQAYTLNAIAYQYSPQLDGVIYSTNWLTENAPDILLFGALVEWNSFNPHPDPRATEWQRRYNNAVWNLYQSQEERKYKGSYIYTKFYNPLNTGGYDATIYGNRTTSGDILTSEGGGHIILE